jgi:hypothetical protein
VFDAHPLRIDAFVPTPPNKGDVATDPACVVKVSSVHAIGAVVQNTLWLRRRPLRKKSMSKISNIDGSATILCEA